MPKLGPWRGALDRMLEANEAKGRRERLTLRRIFEDLEALGYDGGYDAVRRYARTWHRRRSAALAEAYIPLTFAPGEAYQFDWSHEYVVLAGVTTKVKVAHMRLCHSRMFFVRAYRDIAEARAAIGHFIETVYNRQRLHSALDYLTPEEYEVALPPLRQGRAPAAMASTNHTCPRF